MYRYFFMTCICTECVCAMEITFLSSLYAGHQYSTGISDCYELPMVDTIFIRKSQRGKGYGAAVIKDMVKDVGRTDIGFSLPISQGFLAGMTLLFFN